MPATTRTLLLGLAISVAGLSTPTHAQQAPPAGAGAAPMTGTAPDAGSQPGSQATPGGAGDQPEPAVAEGGVLDGAAPHSGSSAQIIALARWVRAIGARVCLGPKITVHDRVSVPDPTNRAQGWRVSVPSFSMSYVSAPPARAHTGAPEQLAEEATPAGPIETAAEPTGN